MLEQLYQRRDSFPVCMLKNHHTFSLVQDMNPKARVSLVVEKTSFDRLCFRASLDFTIDLHFLLFLSSLLHYLNMGNWPILRLRLLIDIVAIFEVFYTSLNGLWSSCTLLHTTFTSDASYSPKIHYFWWIWYTPIDISQESEQQSLSTCLLRRLH